MKIHKFMFARRFMMLWSSMSKKIKLSFKNNRYRNYFISVFRQKCLFLKTIAIMNVLADSVCAKQYLFSNLSVWDENWNICVTSVPLLCQSLYLTQKIFHIGTIVILIWLSNLVFTSESVHFNHSFCGQMLEE